MARRRLAISPHCSLKLRPRVRPPFRSCRERSHRGAEGSRREADVENDAPAMRRIVLPECPIICALHQSHNRRLAAAHLAAQVRQNLPSSTAPPYFWASSGSGKSTDREQQPRSSSQHGPNWSRRIDSGFSGFGQSMGELVAAVPSGRIVNFFSTTCDYSSRALRRSPLARRDCHGRAARGVPFGPRAAPPPQRLAGGAFSCARLRYELLLPCCHADLLISLLHCC